MTIKSLVFLALLSSIGASTTLAPRKFASTTYSYVAEDFTEESFMQKTVPSDLATTSPPSSSSTLPVGAWVGIGFAICITLVLIVFFLVGHRRVREYYVSLMQTRVGRKRPTVAPKQVDVLTLDSIDIRCSTRSDNGRVSDHSFSPRTSDLPFAPVDVELDGRLSPRLPILSKREGSAGGTPSSIRGGV